MEQVSFLREQVVYINKEENKNHIIMETFTKYGGDKLDDTSLISLILGEKVANILNNNGLNTLFKIDMKSDKEFKDMGIGKTSILKIKALISLCKRGTKINTTEKLDSPKKVTDLCEDLTRLDQEILRLICVNTKNEIIHQEDVFKGSLNLSIVHPREILKVAIQCSACNIIIVHNHPSGDPTPSKEDINITLRIKEASKIVGIELLDHIIVGKKGFISLKEKGII